MGSLEQRDRDRRILYVDFHEGKETERIAYSSIYVRKVTSKLLLYEGEVGFYPVGYIARYLKIRISTMVVRTYG